MIRYSYPFNSSSHLQNVYSILDSTVINHVNCKFSSAGIHIESFNIDQVVLVSLNINRTTPPTSPSVEIDCVLSIESLGQALRHVALDDSVALSVEQQENTTHASCYLELMSRRDRRETRIQLNNTTPQPSHLEWVDIPGDMGHVACWIKSKPFTDIVKDTVTNYREFNTLTLHIPVDGSCLEIKGEGGLNTDQGGVVSCNTRLFPGFGGKHVSPWSPVVTIDPKYQVTLTIASKYILNILEHGSLLFDYMRLSMSDGTPLCIHFPFPPTSSDLSVDISFFIAPCD